MPKLCFPEAVSDCMTSPYLAACHCQEGLSDPGRSEELLFTWMNYSLITYYINELLFHCSVFCLLI